MEDSCWPPPGAVWASRRSFCRQRARRQEAVKAEDEGEGCARRVLVLHEKYPAKQYTYTCTAYYLCKCV